MKIKKITPEEHREIKDWFNKIDKLVEDKKSKGQKVEGKRQRVPWSKS